MAAATVPVAAAQLISGRQCRHYFKRFERLRDWAAGFRVEHWTSTTFAVAGRPALTSQARADRKS